MGARKEEILNELEKIEHEMADQEMEEEESEDQDSEEEESEDQELEEDALDEQELEEEAANATDEEAGTPGTIIFAKDYLDAAGLAARQKRLKAGHTEKLYHQTSMWACKSIFKGNKPHENFRPGRGGIDGPGIYFAVKAFHTGWKAQKFGCMIEALVETGKVFESTYEGDKKLTGEEMLKNGFDSTWIPRGGKKGHNTGSLPEVVVYFNDQIVKMTYYRCDKKSGKRHGRFLYPEIGQYDRKCDGASAVHHCADCLTKVYKGGCESPFEPEEPCQCGKKCASEKGGCCSDHAKVCGR